MRKFSKHVTVDKCDCDIDGHYQKEVLMLTFSLKTSECVWTSTTSIQEFIENQYDYALEEQQLYDGLLEAIDKQASSPGGSGPIKFVQEDDAAYLTWTVDNDELKCENRVPPEGSMEQAALPTTQIASVQGPTPNAAALESAATNSPPKLAKDVKELQQKAKSQEERIQALENQIEELKRLVEQATGGKVAGSAAKKAASTANGGEATSSGQSQGKDASKQEKDPTTGQAKTVASKQRRPGKRLRLGG